MPCGRSGDTKAALTCRSQTSTSAGRVGGVADPLVHLAGYDRAWPDLFADQQALVAAILAPWLAAPIEHIGSTSVPGLPAKPVIDMLAPVRSLTASRVRSRR